VTTPREEALMRQPLALVLLSLVLIAPACDGNFHDRLVSESVERTVALDPHGSFKIENPNGLIRVETWDRPEVQIKADKFAASREALGEIRIEISGEGDRVEVATHLPDVFGFLGGSGGSVDYRITLPATVHLEAKTVNGQVEVQGVSGDLRVGSVNGSVTASDVEGEVRASTVNGKVEISHRTLPAEAHHEYSCVNGTIRVYLPESAGGHFRMEWVNGSVDSDFPLDLRSRRPGRQEVDTQLGEGQNDFKFTTVNGTIKILKRREEVRSGVPADSSLI
jgi:hypothetical protein